MISKLCCCPKTPKPPRFGYGSRTFSYDGVTQVENVPENLVSGFVPRSKPLVFILKPILELMIGLLLLQKRIEIRFKFGGQT
jgi:hypothetical protein